MYDAEEKKILFIGIIDFFTFYGWKKKIEHFLKSLKYEGDTISCVPAAAYGQRFIRFMNEWILSPDMF